MKPLAALLAGLLLALPIAARADPPAAWRHGTVLPKGDAGFIYMAAEGGYGAAAGLDIQMVPMRADAMLLKGLLAGELDSYEGSPGAPIIAASHGADLRIIGCHWPGLTYALFATDKVPTVEALRGRTIAIVAPGSLPDLFTRAVLAEHGLTAQDVTLAATMNTLPQLVAGVVDATAATSEYVPDAAGMGLHVLAHAMDATPSFLRLCMITSGAVLREKPELAARFLAVEMRAWRAALADRAGTVALADRVAHLPVGSHSAEAIFDEAVQRHAIDPAMPIDTRKLEWMRDLLAEAGSVRRDFDVVGMVDDRPREAALKMAQP